MTPEAAAKLAPHLSAVERSHALDFADALHAFDRRVPCRVRANTYDALILRVAIVAGHRGDKLADFTSLVRAVLRDTLLHSLSG